MRLNDGLCPECMMMKSPEIYVFCGKCKENYRVVQVGRKGDIKVKEKDVRD
jgi:hypothetical protein